MHGLFLRATLSSNTHIRRASCEGINAFNRDDVWEQCVGTAAVAEPWQEPARGTQTRRDLMDAVRPIAEWQLGAPVQFVVHELRQVGDLAFGTLGAQRPGGGRIDLFAAPANLRGEIYPDHMDGAVYTILFKKSGNMWGAVAWSLGATDAWWAWEPTCRAFGPVIEDFCVEMN